MRRHKKKLTNFYFHKIDKDKTNVEYAFMFEQFYDLVIVEGYASRQWALNLFTLGLYQA